MTDITPIVSQLLKSHDAAGIPSDRTRRPAAGETTAVVDEFLKEAYRINAHISSLLNYLKSIRQPYLSIAPPPLASRRHSHHPSPSITDANGLKTPASQHLTDQERDSIDSSTALLLRDLSSSIANLASAETLRQETQSTLLRKKYGHLTNNILWKWAGGGDTEQSSSPPRTPEQEAQEETEKTIKTVRQSVLWSLRRGLEGAAEAQRSMVEKRIEREKEKEKSVLYKISGMRHGPVAGRGRTLSQDMGGDVGPDAYASLPTRDQSTLKGEDVADIESQLSPEQLQLFAQENDSLLKHYEDTLSKVQNAEKSLLEISSLQQTLVTHLGTQEDYINQLVTDALSTQTNVGRGNQELKRAAERRGTAQAVFWGTVCLCTWLVVWDAVF
ncbi:hypothetical protein AJ80_00847 [Polytolypa hystricis UAMH7299]|uniref:t-SNARE coiled-coil homology domain-containing protein n=1 Tax=Polytolypa hystricis (strain UAMH7299) TaxID=1447883 RepID=A0A2B7Z2A6_POLH7|nr:hypothetical protein AJ80_00847 [Polytolypa hystricis UAMH7299]